MLERSENSRLDPPSLGALTLTSLLRQAGNMMNRALIISVCIVFEGCANNGPIDVSSIRVVRINQHPFLIDHKRKLVTVYKNERTIDELKLYGDRTR